MPAASPRQADQAEDPWLEQLLLGLAGVMTRRLPARQRDALRESLARSAVTGGRVHVHPTGTGVTVDVGGVIHMDVAPADQPRQPDPDRSLPAPDLPTRALLAAVAAALIHRLPPQAAAVIHQRLLGAILSGRPVRQTDTAGGVRIDVGGVIVLDVQVVVDLPDAGAGQED